ncbi:MAG: hypothetical protein HS111_04690 [Kofleriaceae bacterium]|nr:hypothetical protein [Kofleriaceae bacterium]
MTIAGVRYEVPSRYRTLERLSVRYASWDLSMVHLVDNRRRRAPRAAVPADRIKNGAQSRRVVAEVSERDAAGGGEHIAVDDHRDGAALRHLITSARPRGATAGVRAKT